MHESRFDPSTASPNPMSFTDEHASHLTCAVCGDRIGVYERLWMRQSDGVLVASSYLDVRDGGAGSGGAVGVLHLECLTPEAMEGSSSATHVTRPRADAA